MSSAKRVKGLRKICAKIDKMVKGDHFWIRGKNVGTGGMDTLLRVELLSETNTLDSKWTLGIYDVLLDDDQVKQGTYRDFQLVRVRASESLEFIALRMAIKKLSARPYRVIKDSVIEERGMTSPNPRLVSE